MLFADFINYAMDQAGLTKYKLAKDLGVSQSTIANWMNGSSEPRKRRRAEVLDFFGVDEDGLEEGFPEIFYKGNQKEKPDAQGGGQFEEMLMALCQDDRERLSLLMDALAKNPEKTKASFDLFLKTL